MVLKNPNVSIGELVKVSDPDVASTQLSIGIIADIRRHNIKVWFPSSGTASWYRDAQLRRLYPRFDPRSDLTALLSWLILQVNATSFEWQPDEVPVLITETREFSQDKEREIRDFLADILHNWHVRPISMGLLSIEWRLSWPSLTGSKPKIHNEGSKETIS